MARRLHCTVLSTINSNFPSIKISLQRDKLNEMIETFDASEWLKEEYRRASQNLGRLKDRVQALPSELELYCIASKFVQPLEVQYNEIRLYPVQWGNEPSERR